MRRIKSISASLNQAKRSLVNLVLSNLKLDGEKLLWELKKPFDTMAFRSESNSWLSVPVWKLTINDYSYRTSKTSILL